MEVSLCNYLYSNTNSRESVPFHQTKENLKNSYCFKYLCVNICVMYCCYHIMKPKEVNYNCWALFSLRIYLFLNFNDTEGQVPDASPSGR